MLPAERGVFAGARCSTKPGRIQPVAIVEVLDGLPPLRLAPSDAAEVVMRIQLQPDDVERLVASGVNVVVLDLRGLCTSHIRPSMRLLRLLVSNLRVVAVTDAGDDAAAQMAIAAGAIAHLSRDTCPLRLLRAVHAASRGTPHLGETGQRAVARLTGC
ncbi:hypothetical protein [Pseudomarimonas arenosa]|uniref:DNA-binding response regulator n=1 Tax=Pseudomarimonas arenosa TaxID=2774145 RepID=A0AAW3ZH20_9GAMM|nr:hypothetical protein [Pseudomarimonas arenosa]MBD8525420.1 hypothetical protein [Pseudomarimonas arenosa]